MPLWITLIGWITKLILAILIGLSIWSIAIMWDRYQIFKRIRGALKLSDLKSQMVQGGLKAPADSSHEIPLALTASVLQKNHSLPKENLELYLKSELTQSRNQLEKGLTVLASLGSNAPFIGLFGTVLGIIQAFGALAVAQGDTTMVMAAISEALIATAVGLMVAIPATIAFNVFQRDIKLIFSECDQLRDLFLSQRK